MAVLIRCKFIHSVKISGMTSFPLDDNPFPAALLQDGSTAVHAGCKPPLSVLFSSMCKWSYSSCSCLKRNRPYKETHRLSVYHGVLAQVLLSCLQFSCSMWRSDCYQAADKHDKVSERKPDCNAASCNLLLV